MPAERDGDAREVLRDGLLPWLVLPLAVVVAFLAVPLVFLVMKPLVLLGVLRLPSRS